MSTPTSRPDAAPLAPTGRGGAARRGTVLVLIGVLLSMLFGVTAAQSAAAHPLSTSAVLLDIESDAVTGTIQIPIDRLAIALDEPLTADTVLEPAQLASLRDYVQQHIGATGADGAAWTVTVAGGGVESVDAVGHLVFDVSIVPDAGAVTDFTLRYDAVVDELLSHRIFVSARAGSDGDFTSIGMIDWSALSVDVPAADFAPTPLSGFVASVRLGFSHIIEGADHLLFLLMLLLPAPFVAMRGRWVPGGSVPRAGGRVLRVVTAFAIGHSITLALGVFGLVQVPTRAVESLIALSVVVSGVHAVRPLVAGGEAWIAAGFGLMHGLAFATLLTELDLGRESLLVDLLGFNVGIELTQLVVVALVMPWLVLLSRTRLATPVRLTLAVGGIVLATAWFLERATLIATNPLEPVAEALVAHPFVVVMALAATAVLARALRPRHPTAHPTG